MFAPLIAYRGFIISAVRREFTVRYARSLLGVGWALLQPIALIFVYTLIFSKLMAERLPLDGSPMGYGLYLCAGLFAWSLHSEVVTRCASMFLEQGALLKKVAFPRLCVPAIVGLGATLNYLIVLALFLVVLVVLGKSPGLGVLAVLPLIVIQLAFSLGVGLIVGVLNVFFRDIGHLVALGLQLWFWLTPIVYPAEILPEPIRSVLSLNPMAVLISAWQKSLVFQSDLAWGAIGIVAFASAVLMLIGVWLLARFGDVMMDEL
jgi:lipopolysaccharide transport system permease protein